MKKITVILTLIAALTVVCRAQKNLLFENFSVKDGLSNPSGNCILQDKYGFLWIGTDDGLNRYDGYAFKVYKNNPGDTSSIFVNTIYSLMEDQQGRLWIGGNGALFIYNREKDNFKQIKIDRGSITSNIQIWSIFEDSKNRIWIGTRYHGVYLINQENNEARLVYKKGSIDQSDWKWPQGIIETHSGRILITDTVDGVYYFDEGNSEFLKDEKLSVPGSKGDYALYEDEFNRIWLGNSSGVLLIDPQKNDITGIDLFSSYKTPPRNTQVLKIINDQNGYLWFATWKEGLFRYNPVSGEKEHFFPDSDKPGSIAGSQIISLYEDQFGIIWAGTVNSGISKVDPDKEPLNIYQIPAELKSNNVATDMITAITTSETQRNEIWIGTRGIGLFKYDLKNKRNTHFQHMPKNSNTISSDRIDALNLDAQGNLWIATDSSLMKFDQNRQTFSNYLREDVGLTYNFRITDIEIDATGRMYLATPHGVDLFIPGGNVLRRIPSLANRRYNSELLSAIRSFARKDTLATILKVGERQDLKRKFEVREPSKVLIVAGGEGLFQDTNNMSDFGWLQDAAGDTVWAFDDIHRTFYMGGGIKNRMEAACLTLNPGTYTLSYQSDVGHSYGNWNVTPPDDPDLWGIQVIGISDDQFKNLSEQIEKERTIKNYIPLERATAIYLSRKFENVLWIGNDFGIIYKYNLKENSYKTYNLNTFLATTGNYQIQDILEDNNGKVWFCTNKGLVELSLQTEKFVVYTEQDGLPSNTTLAIHADNYDNMWVSSIAGLTKIIKTPDEGKYTFINIDVADGLQGYSFTNASWKAADGEMFFGGFNGLNYFYPGKLNQSLPAIVINGFTISNRPVNAGTENSPVEKDINDVHQITLSYDQNDFAFEFAAIHFSRPQRNKIAYKLDGINDDWIYDNRRFASFTNLAPGEYLFRLKGANGDGIWNDKEKQIAITILPPWWRTNMAYIMYFVILAAGIFAIDRIQRRRLLKRARETARMREAELRAQLAEAENERKTKELEEARQVQLSMLPRELPQLPHLDIAVYMQTATEVGGDYYDFHVGMDGSLTVVVGDATGHGMKAGTMVTTAKSLFNSYAPNPDILFSFQEITRCIKQMNMGKMSMCMTMLKIQDSRMQMSSAGMPPSFVFRRDTRIVEEHLMQGMPLGTMDKFPYKILDTKLKAGDTILLLTDGLPELQNENDELYGYKRIRNVFEEVAEKNPEEIISFLKEEGSMWVNNKDPEDDVTFVVIKVK
jgi:serine phosphatase RsbU (regulator of sigma subunit)/ligand-binding sensor domain-containing protein